MAFTGNNIQFKINTGYTEPVAVIAQEYNCSILKELYYVVCWDNSHSFIVAYNFERHCLEIQGAAPYLAREYQHHIANAIQNYNDGLV